MFFPGARDKVDSAAVSELVRDEPVARRQSLIRISTHTLSNANTNTDTDAYSNKYRSVSEKKTLSSEIVKNRSGDDPEVGGLLPKK